ncbi:MAG TPA: efflux RND transporter periplasmic adaptor subunit [Anaeromyxobacteraceae bacterium]|nr:efflux RND transporter periplasmic adaptor subunit [Anaeromyxobacteraceae bacterium]
MLRRPWPWLGFAALAALLALGGRSLLGPSVHAYRATRAELVQRVVASGRVLAPARIQVGSVVLGRVTRVAVDKGDRVKQGDLLVQLDDAEARASLAQARAAVAQAGARLEQVEVVSARTTAEALRQAELRVEQAEVKKKRTETLAAAGSVSQSDLDDAVKAYDLAASQLASARVQAQAAAAGADQRAAKAALEQARAAELAAATRLDQLSIRAPAAGVVVERDVEPGDVVQAGKALLVVARDGPVQLSVLPDEKNLPFLDIGQKARASADAFPDRIFPATVAYIAPSVDLARGTVEVKLDVPDPPPFLRPDMTVSVNVEAARDHAAVVLPADAVRDAGRDPWVLVARRGRAERQPVQLGIRGDGRVQILAGVSEGEAVLPASAAVAPGSRVRASTGN